MIDAAPAFAAPSPPPPGTRARHTEPRARRTRFPTPALRPPARVYLSCTLDLRVEENLWQRGILRTDDGAPVGGVIGHPMTADDGAQLLVLEAQALERLFADGQLLLLFVRVR